MYYDGQEASRLVIIFVRDVSCMYVAKNASWHWTWLLGRKLEHIIRLAQGHVAQNWHISSD